MTKVSPAKQITFYIIDGRAFKHKDAAEAWKKERNIKEEIIKLVRVS